MGPLLFLEPPPPPSDSELLLLAFHLLLLLMFSGFSCLIRSHGFFLQTESCLLASSRLSPTHPLSRAGTRYTEVPKKNVESKQFSISMTLQTDQFLSPAGFFQIWRDGGTLLMGLMLLRSVTYLAFVGSVTFLRWLASGVSALFCCRLLQLQQPTAPPRLLHHCSCTVPSYTAAALPASWCLHQCSCTAVHFTVCRLMPADSSASLHTAHCALTCNMMQPQPLALAL